MQQEIKKYYFGEPSNKLSPQTLKELDIYKSLALSALESLLSGIFPLCKSLLGSEWNSIVIDYHHRYPSSSAIFNRAAAAFPEYLAERTKIQGYLPELALYEWLEVELRNAVATEPSKVLTPVHTICKFKYPITEIVTALQSGSEITDLRPAAQQVLIFRDEQSLEVKFFLLQGASSYILNSLSEAKTLESSFAELCEVFKIKDEALEEAEKAFNKLIEKLKNNNILIE